MEEDMRSEHIDESAFVPSISGEDDEESGVSFCPDIHEICLSAY